MKKHITKKWNECNFVSSSLNESSSLNKSSSLKEHKKMHREKMHKCNECDFAAFKKFNLKGHKKDILEFSLSNAPSVIMHPLPKPI